MGQRLSFAGEQGSNVESLAHIFSGGIPSGLAEWGLGIAFVSVCAVLIARLRLRLPRVTRREAVFAAVQDAPETSPVPSREAADPVSLSDMQAQAAFHIDAAEHALNRLLADCAPVAAVPVNPTVTAQRDLPKTAGKPDRSSLAA